MPTTIIQIKSSFSHVFVGRMIEWEHSVMLMLFGWLLFVEVETFDTATSYQGFKELYANPGFWGTMMVGVGGFRFLVLLKNGTIKRSPHLRAFCAMLSAFFWFEAFYGAVVAGKLSPFTVLCTSFFAWEFVIWIICIRYAKLEDKKVVVGAGKNNS